MSTLGKSADLKAKTEKLEKLKREKLLRDAMKVKEDKEKASNTVKDEQDAVNKLISKAEKYAEVTKEKDREEEIKKKLEQRMGGGSPLKRLLANTVANFVGELSIPAKVKFAMYDKLVQAGDSDTSILVGTDDPFEIIPPVSAAAPQQFRPVLDSTIHNIKIRVSHILHRCP